MNAEQASRENVWSRRKFWITFGLIFVIQLAWLFLLGRPAATTVQEPPRPTSFRMVAKALPSGAFDTFLVTDPTLFVLPSRDSFSGAAWMNVKEMDYTPTEWSEPPRWLPFHPERLMSTFNQFVHASRNSLRPVSEKMAPYEPLPSLPSVASSAKSRVRVDGEVASRVASDLPILDPWQSPEPLDRSVVEVGVNEAGQVVSTRLIQRSGLVTADHAALKFASKFRFSPLTSARLMIGKINFLWHTEPVILTNTAPAALESR